MKKYVKKILFLFLVFFVSMIFLRYFFLNEGINFVYHLCIQFVLTRLRVTYVNVMFTKKLKKFTKKSQDNLIKNFEKHFLV